MSEEPSTLKVIASQVALAAIDGGAPPKIHDAVLTYIFEIKRCAYSRLKVLLLLSNPVNARHHSCNRLLPQIAISSPREKLPEKETVVPLSTITWNDRGFDIHVVRNAPFTSPDLTQDLIIVWSDRAPFRANNIPADLVQSLRIHFEPRFAGAPAGFNMSINTANGTMQPGVAPPGVQLRNFIMDAVVHDTSPGGLELRQKIRIHVHNSIQSIWLTPRTLTVHQNAAHVRFTALAQFDDGVVGEIDDQQTLRWTAVTPGSVDVDDRTGELTVKAATGDFVVEVRRAGAAANSPPDAIGTVRCAPPWATPTPVNFVAGKGADHRDDVPNILFLPDGFLPDRIDGGSAAFDALVRAIVRQLRMSTSTRPYDLLSNEMNYWSAFVPSRQAGMTVATELAVIPQPGGLLGAEVPLPVDPAQRVPPLAPGQPWTLAEMIHEVGLPVPVDDNNPLPLDGAGGKLAAWQTLYGPQVTRDRIAVYEDASSGLWWLLCARRSFLNDLDTSFSLRLGKRPGVEQQQSKVFREPVFNPLRIAPDNADGMAADFAAFLGNLQFQGNTIGARWATNGQDFDRICVLGRSNREGGVNARTQGYIACTLDNDGIHVVADAQPDPGFNPQAKPVPTNPSIQLTAAVAHEIAHSFNLEDEYGEHSNDPRALKLPADQVAAIAREANITDEAAIRAAHTDLDTDPIVPASIKWNWPRIKKAGILADKPGSVGRGTFQLKMQPGHASLFRQGDVVKLRGRDLLPPATAGAPAPMPLTTYVMQVDSVDPGDLMTISGTGGTPDPTLYPAGSVLLCPVRDSSGNSDLNLIAPIVLNYLATAQEPLNRPKATPVPVCTFDLDPRQTARNLPNGLPSCRPRKRNMIVGLWDGGKTFHCGVYHPTGFCIMRSRIEGSQITGFCTVCRYFMVDRIDPTKHGKLDDEYAKYYPQP